MRALHGFTLVETLISTAILLTGLVSIASLFAVSINNNLTNEQRTTATLLLRDKMEAFKAEPITASSWIAGGSVDGAAPVAGFVDYLSVAPDGSTTSSSTDASLAYSRLWKISDSSPRSITVVVFSNRGGLNRKPIEMARATTIVGSAF